MTDKTYWTQVQIAKMLDLSQGRISQMVKEGMPHIPVPENERSGRGHKMKFHPRSVIDWMIQREIAKYQVKAEQSGELTQAEADRLKTIAEWRIKQADADYKDATAINADDAILAFEKMITTFRAQNEAMAGRLANELAVIDDPAKVRARILDEAKSACRTSADIARVFFEAYRKTLATVPAAE